MIKNLFRKKDVYVLFSMRPAADEAKRSPGVESPAEATAQPRLLESSTDEVKAPLSVEPAADETELPLCVEPSVDDARPPPNMPVSAGALAKNSVGTGIAYHRELISGFCDEHEALRNLLSYIKKCAGKDEFVDAQHALQAFRIALTSHLLDEHIKLYAYLSPRLAEVPEHKKLLLAMKSEKGRIDAAVTQWVNKYPDPASISRDRQPFLDELEHVGTVLFDHIEREEASLYVLYTPADGSSS